MVLDAQSQIGIEVVVLDVTVTEEDMAEENGEAYDQYSVRYEWAIEDGDSHTAT